MGKIQRLTTCTHLTVLLLAIGSLTIRQIQGQDEYMTCSRPVKSFRSSRQHVPLPCETMDHGKESWCTLPGPLYPWHSVRRFVFENQGLMRRMYGEVRQLSLLRMEFSGDSNTLEESRDFGDLFKPVTTFDPSLTLTSHFTTESLPTLVVTSSEDEIGNLTSNVTTEKNVRDGEGGPGRVEDTDPLTTIADLMTTTEETGSGIVEKEGGETVLADAVVGGPTEEPLPPQTTLGASDDEERQPSIEIVIPLEGNPGASSSDSPLPPSQVTSPEDEKTRNEGQVLFQDFEKSTTTTTTTTEEPRIRTTNRQGVNACPVKEEVVAPYWANNTRGEVLALLNLYPFEQYIHWEKCTNEHRQMYCRDGCRCEQQYRLHRLLAFDPQNECRGIFSDWFRFPSCCVCKCYFDDSVPERVSFNRSPRLFTEDPNLESNIFNNLDMDGPDVNGVDDSHFFYKYSSSFRQPRK